MQANVRLAIALIRVAAIIVMVLTVMALWNFMLWLPWQLDAVIAAVGSLAFAYKFERNAGH
jgi:hypothetical protein